MFSEYCQKVFFSFPETVIKPILQVVNIHKEGSLGKNMWKTSIKYFKLDQLTGFVLIENIKYFEREQVVHCT